MEEEVEFESTRRYKRLLVFKTSAINRSATLPYWCERRNSNPYTIKVPDPKSGASANFATLALLNKNGCGSRYRPWLNKVMSLARALCLPSATIF